jgi:hypothetical protein
LTFLNDFKNYCKSKLDSSSLSPLISNLSVIYDENSFNKLNNSMINAPYNCKCDKGVKINEGVQDVN